jgi:hypothetical protein
MDGMVIGSSNLNSTLSAWCAFACEVYS